MTAAASSFGLSESDFFVSEGSTDYSTDGVADDAAVEADDHDTRLLVHSHGTVNVYMEEDGILTYEDASGPIFTARSKKDGSFCSKCMKNCQKPKKEAEPCHLHLF